MLPPKLLGYPTRTATKFDVKGAVCDLWKTYGIGIKLVQCFQTPNDEENQELFLFNQNHIFSFKPLPPKIASKAGQK